MSNYKMTAVLSPLLFAFQLLTINHTVAEDSILTASPSGTDWDSDYIDDGFETMLAQKFFPSMNMYCGDADGVAQGSLGQFYGSGVGYATSGKLPFTAHIYVDGGLTPCNESGRCIEIRYGLPYNWDLGDDQFGGGHSGDTEHFAILISTNASWDVASVDLSVWLSNKYFMSAHACALGDSSTFGLGGIASGPQLWVARGKNSNYRQTSECDDGGSLGADDCSDGPRCTLDMNAAISRLQNVWEFGDPTVAPFGGHIPRGHFTNGYDGISGDQYIPRPGFTATTNPGTPYDVWSADSFGGTDGAGTFCRHLSRFLDWRSEEQSCDAHPDCP
jgi:hypothetical protein